MQITRATNFILEEYRNQVREDIHDEYLHMIAIFYGDDVISGAKRLSDFRDMTMQDVANELKIRTIIYKGMRLRKKRELKEEHAKAEEQFMEELRSQ